MCPTADSEYKDRKVTSSNFHSIYVIKYLCKNRTESNCAEIQDFAKCFR